MHAPLHTSAWLLRWMGLSVVFAALPSQALAQEKYQPRVGDAHPDFVLPRIGDGKPVALSQFRGKKVLLIHFASW